MAIPPVKFLKLHMIIKNGLEIYDIDADPGIIESIEIQSATDAEVQEEKIRFSITFVAPAAWFGMSIHPYPDLIDSDDQPLLSG